MIYKGKNFDFELFQNKQVVYGSFISFKHDNIRGRGMIYRQESELIEQVRSSNIPDISGKILYIPGDRRNSDNELIFAVYSTEEIATKYYKDIIEILKKADEEINKYIHN